MERTDYSDIDTEGWFTSKLHKQQAYSFKKSQNFTFTALKDNILRFQLWMYFKGRTKLLHFISMIPLNAAECMKNANKIHPHKVLVTTAVTYARG